MRGWEMVAAVLVFLLALAGIVWLAFNVNKILAVVLLFFLVVLAGLYLAIRVLQEAGKEEWAEVEAQMQRFHQRAPSPLSVYGAGSDVDVVSDEPKGDVEEEED